MNAEVYPASYDNCISVTSVGHINPIGYTDPIYGQTNWRDVHEEFIGDTGTAHHHNSAVDICAPGYNVASTTISNDYQGVWGTSFASPQIAGITALILSVNPCLSRDETVDILLSTAVDIDNLPENITYNGLLGAGRADAFEAVKKAQGYNETIYTGESLTWNSFKSINGILLLEENSQLIIDTKVYFNENSNVVIKNGAKLIVESNGYLTNFCNKTWTGIIVEPGGCLELRSGSTIDINGSGSILADLNTNYISSLIYNQGALINLDDNDSNIEIKGELEIADNTTFTFTGNGYIKFSKPGTDTQTEGNIIAGTGSSFYLKGSGQSDTKMITDQSTVFFPDNLDLLKFEDCQIKMGPSDRLKAGTGISNIVLDNTKITSVSGLYNTHRSLNYYGTSNISIDNCTFEYGRYGFYANLSTSSGPSYLEITNSNFSNNYYGLRVYNKGISLSGCDFHNNTYYAIKCDNMSYGSLIDECTIINSSSGLYRNGVFFIGSASADLEISYAEIKYADLTGIFTSGGFELDLNCSDIQHCDYGVKAYSGNYVIPYANDIINNTKSIYLYNALIDLENKGNMLYSTNDDYALGGYTPVSWVNCFTPPALTATKNIWESDLTSTPQYGVNHNLKVYNTGCNPALSVSVTDNSPGENDCISFFIPASSGNNIGDIETENSNTNILSSLCDDFSVLDSENAYQNELADYCLAINNFIPQNSSEYLQKRKAYSNAHKLVNAYLEYLDFNTESNAYNQAIDMLVELNEDLINSDFETELSKIDYSLDIALLERSRRNYNIAVEHLESLVSDIYEYELEQSFVQRWLCSLYAEKQLIEGSINHDEFEELITECAAVYDASIDELSEEIPNDDNNENITYLNISPNPNSGSFTILVNCEEQNAEIRISNSIGQPISTYSLNNTGEQVISISGYNSGQYTVYYIVNTELVESVAVFVE